MPKKVSLLDRLLYAITFGRLGKPQKKRASRKNSRQKTVSETSPRPQRAAAAPKAKRERAPVTSSRLYVGNLDYSTSEADLEELFRGIGNVTSAEVVTNPRTQQSKGFAFVEMGSIGEAERAIDILDDEEFRGRRLVVNEARNGGSEESIDAA